MHHRVVVPDAPSQRLETAKTGRMRVHAVAQAALPISSIVARNWRTCASSSSAKALSAARAEPGTCGTVAAIMRLTSSHRFRSKASTMAKDSISAPAWQTAEWVTPKQSATSWSVPAEWFRSSTKAAGLLC